MAEAIAVLGQIFGTAAGAGALGGTVPITDVFTKSWALARSLSASDSPAAAPMRPTSGSARKKSPSRASPTPNISPRSAAEPAGISSSESRTLQLMGRSHDPIRRHPANCRRDLSATLGNYFARSVRTRHTESRRDFASVARSLQCRAIPQRADLPPAAASSQVEALLVVLLGQPRLGAPFCQPNPFELLVGYQDRKAMVSDTALLRPGSRRYPPATTIRKARWRRHFLSVSSSPFLRRHP